MTGTDYTLFTHKSVPVIFEPPCIKYKFGTVATLHAVSFRLTIPLENMILCIKKWYLNPKHFILTQNIYIDLQYDILTNN
jgi:hypothetical protein